MRLRPDVVVVAQLKTLCFELKSPSRIILSESEVRDLSFFLCVCVGGGGGGGVNLRGEQKKSRFDKGGIKFC